MKFYKLIIQFDGTAYKGWQAQKHDLGVQEVVETVLNRLYNHKGLEINGSGRTDAGVHAFGLCASFSAPHDKFTPDTLRKGMNALLPDQVRIRQVDEVDEDFHGRFSCVGKTYIYFIENTLVGSAILNRFTWHTRYDLDFKAIEDAAILLEGKHDFSSFTVQRSELKGHAVRTIYRCGIFRHGNLLAIHVTGDGFLYKMVRSIAGFLIEVGRGTYQPEEVEGILAAIDRSASGVTAPAKGLFLAQCYYKQADLEAFLESKPQDLALACLFGT